MGLLLFQKARFINPIRFTGTAKYRFIDQVFVLLYFATALHAVREMNR